MKHHFSRGIALPLAIFVVLVLAAMVGYLMRLFVLSTSTETQDIQATRAYFAARAGIEWSAYQVMRPGSNNLQNCPPNQIIVFDGFNVALACVRSNAFDSAGTEEIAIYQVVATATRGVRGQTDYAERQLQMSISRCMNPIDLTECN